MNRRLQITQDDHDAIAKIISKYLSVDDWRLMCERRAKLICLDWEWYVLDMDFTKKEAEQCR